MGVSQPSIEILTVARSLSDHRSWRLASPVLRLMGCTPHRSVGRGDKCIRDLKFLKLELMLEKSVAIGRSAAPRG